MKIAFDIGGVLSKYPDTFRRLVDKLQSADPGRKSSVEVVIISDMHDIDQMHRMLKMNNFAIERAQIFSADYAQYGEYCKTQLCNQLGVDILIDDFIGYLAEGDFIRLLMMPNVDEPYYHDDWKTDGSEGDFGRRCRPRSRENEE
jgi:hypothetical protein